MNMTENRKFGETAKFNFDLNKKLALQVIPKDVKDDGIHEAVKYACEKLSTTFVFNKVGGTNTIIIITENEDHGEKIVKELSNWIAYHFDTLLEEKTGIERERFYRSSTFFELSVQDKTINIQWS